VFGVTDAVPLRFSVSLRLAQNPAYACVVSSILNVPRTFAFRRVTAGWSE
jgi:hypothetical protein